MANKVLRSGGLYILCSVPAAVVVLGIVFQWSLWITIGVPTVMALLYGIALMIFIVEEMHDYRE